MLRNELKRIVEPVESRLVDFFDVVKNQPRHGMFRTHADSRLLAEIRDLTLRGGKRIRAALLIEGAGLFDPTTRGHGGVIEAAAALELFHVYLLVHDDIMDGDTLRRGGMSVHAALAQESGDEMRGVGLGILAGDLAASLAQGLLCSADLPPDRSLRAQRIFADMHLDVVHGQYLDMSANVLAEEVATHKTASYTTIGPLAMGAALGGASDQQIDHLARLALPLGIAFQFADDLLGTFGTSATTGKPSGADLKAGKQTILIEEGRARANSVQSAAIERALGNENASNRDIEAARTALVDCGAKQACRSRIRELIEEFETGICASTYDEGRTRFLRDLARFIEQRDR